MFEFIKKQTLFDIDLNNPRMQEKKVMIQFLEGKNNIGQKELRVDTDALSSYKRSSENGTQRFK